MIVSTCGNFSTYIVIYFIEADAVMDIAGSHHRLKHKTILVASCGMRLVGKLSLVLSFCETGRCPGRLRFW